jgi:hypothetical protein
MGTRFLLICNINNTMKLTNISSNNGSPDAAGIAIIDFLTTHDINIFIKNLKSTSFLSKRKYNQIWDSLGVSRDAINISQTILEQYESQYPSLKANIGVDILNIIYNNKHSLLRKNLSNPSSIGTIDWTYIIDFDNNTFETYSGYNHFKLDNSDRFFNLFPPIVSGNNIYYPPKMQSSFSLNNLPSLTSYLNSIPIL